MTGSEYQYQATLKLPDWVGPFLACREGCLGSDDERMEFVLTLARENVERRTGGSFGAAVFERDSGVLVSVGVNCVIPQQASLAHAEVMAILFAQRRLGTFDLGGEGVPPHELVTSAQMCAMCYGATLWSGVRRVVCGATRDDVATILGFDEGPLSGAWVKELEQREIAVRQGVLRDEAQTVLRRYAELQGVLYHSRQGGER